MRNWWRERRQRKYAKKPGSAPTLSELREFIYLDDVSVFSLLSSRVGAIDAEFTDNQSTALMTEATIEGGGDIKVVQAKTSGRLQASSNQGSQVLRKATIQSTFKRLYEIEKAQGSFVLRPNAPEDDKPPLLPTDRDGLSIAVSNSEYAGWITKPTAFARGGLIELDVQLDSDTLFRASTIFSSMLGMMEEYPEMFSEGGGIDLHGIGGLARLLETMLVGLVPIKGRVVGYEGLRIEGAEYVVRSELLDRADALPSSMTRLPLYVVGVAEEGLFWKDLRRVLFSGSKYTVFGRVARPGINTTWTPVKLADLLQSIQPDLVRSMHEAARSFEALAGHVPAADHSLLTAQLLGALESYEASLREALSLDAPGSSIALAVLADKVPEAVVSNVTVRRQTFGEITLRIEQEMGVDVDPVLASRCRTNAFLEAGLPMDGTLPASPDFTPPTVPAEDHLVLDTEIVAMYW
ncbi:MAG: hypothetical protein JWM90_2158 [Thermoleophilia bacterium]|nr:hypothetical protein [Thermoleophilia bacterium]